MSTNAGYRLELHPPREWIEDLLEGGEELKLAELHLQADEPEEKARALADLLGLEAWDGAVSVGDTIVRFVPGGPQGRPQLHAELFI